LIGKVSQVLVEKASNTYTLKIKTAANFYNVQFVYVINNLLKEEPQELLKRVKKTNE
jgi:rod shape-determining protein MreC